METNKTAGRGKERHMTDKIMFADTMAKSLGSTASSIMTDCEKYGMTWGCDEDCPALNRGECKIYKNVEDMRSDLSGARMGERGEEE